MLEVVGIVRRGGGGGGRKRIWRMKEDRRVGEDDLVAIE